MKLRNTTDFSDHLLRRLVSWCAKQVGYPLRRITEARFRNRDQRAYSGRAYIRSRLILVSIGPTSSFPTEPDTRPGIVGLVFADRTEALIGVTAHEIAHLLQWAENRATVLKRRRKLEHDARWFERRVLESFRANREQLLAKWSMSPPSRTRVKPTVQAQRATKARAALDRWQRKAKLAATKIKAYKRQVRYYDAVLAARGEAPQ